MTLRGLRLAMQFLTRLPVPGVDDFSPLDLARTLGKLLGVDAGGAHSHDLACARTP